MTLSCGMSRDEVAAKQSLSISRQPFQESCGVFWPGCSLVVLDSFGDTENMRCRLLGTWP